jgi:hypothetical protein
MKEPKKKVVSEGVIEGILATITLAILGKVVIYFMYELAKKVGNYVNGNEKYKKAVAKILESISNNKQAMNDIAKLMDSNDGINNGVADKIVRMGYVQTLIIKMVESTNSELDETELTNYLKTALLKAWEDKGLTDRAAEKVKKDIK